jgi:hypothetical protein
MAKVRRAAAKFGPTRSCGRRRRTGGSYQRASKNDPSRRVRRIPHGLAPPPSDWHRASPRRSLLPAGSAPAQAEFAVYRSCYSCRPLPDRRRRAADPANPGTPLPRRLFACAAGVGIRTARAAAGGRGSRGHQTSARHSADFGRTCAPILPAARVRGRPLIAAGASLSPFRRKRPRGGGFQPATKKGG